MHALSLALLPLLAITAAAVPFAGHSHQHLHRRAEQKREEAKALEARDRTSTFKIHITNSCSTSQSFGIFQITDDFAMNQISSPVSIDAGVTQTIHAPYYGIGMRLSGTADQGAAAQWSGQPLFEFGYSTYAGQEGTAYDLSLIGTPIVGLSVTPGNTACEAKTCTSDSCSTADAWTSASQVDIGSPADTVCYEGKTDFAVTWCAT